MKVTIYFKASAETAVYDFDMEEFKRLATDYEQFLKSGSPINGVYMCRDAEGEMVSATSKKIVLQFDNISAIG